VLPPLRFAALLGEDTNGRWRIAPTSGGRCTRRRYGGHTLVLETEWETPGGAVRVVDCMPPRGVAPDLVRVVEGLRGKVSVTSELRIRFDYGHVAAWVTIEGREVRAVAGPDALWGIGRHREAEELFARLLALRDDVGLLSEEYDTRAQRLVGNFPQAFTHLALVNCALRLSEREVSSAARE
jgi:GH15 family glucan-1,4-alpha-glucosidase